jgi:hypothetical protein
MNPEQITERLTAIKFLIDDASQGILDLQNEMAQASNDADGSLTILLDIGADMNLNGMRNSLAVMRSNLGNNMARCLPYHFERLRTGAA